MFRVLINNNIYLLLVCENLEKMQRQQIINFYYKEEGGEVKQHESLSIYFYKSKKKRETSKGNVKMFKC